MIFRLKASNILILSSLFLFAFSWGCMSNEHGSVDPASSDTCSYYLNVPPDLDMPQTPPFDTTIVRNKDCKVNVFRLGSWGTQTSYILTPEDANLIGKYKPRSTECSAQHEGVMDITDLPDGTYTMLMQACGNGGFFTVRLK